MPFAIDACKRLSDAVGMGGAVVGNAAKQKVGVSHGHGLAAKSVGNGTGIGARALRPYLEHAAAVEPGDGTAARNSGGHA